MRKLLIAVATFVICGSAARVHAQPAPLAASAQHAGTAPVAPEDSPRSRSHELTVLLGMMPAGDFTNHITATLAYSVELSPLWVWELVHASYAHGYRTKLADELDVIYMATRNFRAPDFPEIIGVVGSNIHLRARYDGRALVGTDALALETRLYTGPVGVFRQHASADVNLGFDVGVQLRGGLGELFALVLDAGVLGYFPARTPIDLLTELYARGGVALVF